MNLNNNQELISFFHELLQNERINIKAPSLIKFFIITRDYGLLSLRENIASIINGVEFEKVVANALHEGFSRDGIPFNSYNVVNFLVTNYHKNGFYYYSFPGIYQNAIRENGLPVKRDDNISKIISKYNLGELFKQKDIVVEYLSNRKTHENALRNPFMDIDIDDLKKEMKKKNGYKEDDYVILCNYIEDSLKNYINSKHNIGIALIEKRNMEDYFGKTIDENVVKPLNDFVQESRMSDLSIVDFITKTISSREEEIMRPIPKDIINVFSYQVDNNEKQRRNEIENSHYI